MFFELLLVGSVGYFSYKVYDDRRRRQLDSEAEARFSRRLEELGASNIEAFIHEGGHPTVPVGVVVGWAAADGLMFAGSEDGPAVKIAFADVNSVDVSRRVHTEHIGANYRGVRLGRVYLGGKTANDIRVDESTTVIAFRYGAIKVKMVLSGGQDTYAKLMPLLAAAQK